MRPKHASVAQIAAVQNGRITTKQLIEECDMKRAAVRRAERSGKLHRLHRGVFAVGHLAPSRLGDWHGAVLACGSHAYLSRRCAATAYKIRDGVGPKIDVTVTNNAHRERPGIAIHRADLLPFEVGLLHRIPITSPSRTMVDLAHEQLTEEEIEWAFRELQFKRLFDRKLLELSLHRRPSRVITRLLDHIEPTRSPLEIAFLTRVVRRHRLPPPEVNVSPDRFLVDFLWPEAKLIVETDGSNHDQPSMRAADALRDEHHDRLGYLTLRYRWADVHADARTAAEVLHHWRERVA